MWTREVYETLLTQQRLRRASTLGMQPVHRKTQVHGKWCRPPGNTAHTTFAFVTTSRINARIDEEMNAQLEEVYEYVFSFNLTGYLTRRCFML
jgi:hypothetical protein